MQCSIQKVKYTILNVKQTIQNVKYTIHSNTNSKKSITKYYKIRVLRIVEKVLLSVMKMIVKSGKQLYTYRAYNYNIIYFIP